MIVRKYAKHKGPRNLVQASAREKFVRKSKKAAQAWAKLSLADKDRCRRLALKKKLTTGFMAFTQIWWAKGGKPGALKIRAPRMGRQLDLKMKLK